MLQVLHRESCSSSSQELAALGEEAARLRQENEVLQSKAMVAHRLASDASMELSATAEDLSVSRQAERLLVDRVEAAEGEAADLKGRNASLERENANLLKQVNTPLGS